MNLFLFAFVGISVFMSSLVFAESSLPELKRQVNENYMAVELSQYLIDNKVNWALPEKELSAHVDVGRNAPWTLCTELVHSDEQTFYLSVTNLDDYSMSDVSYHTSLPSDCAFFVNPPQIITNPDNFVVEGGKPHEWLRSCWKFDYTIDFFTVDNPYRYTSPQHRDYIMCKTAIDLNLYESDLQKLGKHLDWNNYADQITSEYLNNWNFGNYDAFPETLQFQTFVSNRDSLPPKMHATVTFDYSENGSLKTFDDVFEISPLYSPALFLQKDTVQAKALCESDDVELVDGVCKKVISEKSSESDDSIFGFFTYLENFFSWLLGK